jgi:hypothetical protein
MQNISKIKRCEISTYKTTNLWTEEDDICCFTTIVNLHVIDVETALPYPPLRQQLRFAPLRQLLLQYG